jgi:hypothetical protein
MFEILRDVMGFIRCSVAACGALGFEKERLGVVRSVYFVRTRVFLTDTPVFATKTPVFAIDT